MEKSNIVRRKSNYLKKIIITFLSISVLIIAVLFLSKLINKNSQTRVSASDVVKAWSIYDYEEVYNLSSVLLEKNPINNLALIYHGYASFYLALAQLDATSSQNYLDEAINCLRIALYDSKNKNRPQIEYILGKSYFYKNTVSSYYYADSAINYLNSAKEHGYKADDIYEYLGLSYAALNMTMESISAFTEALLVRESFSLLLSIGEQYYKLGQYNIARQYLFRIINECKDDGLLNKSLNLLGSIFIEEKNYSEAKKTFESILQKNQNSADAYYGLGVIYEKQGDLVKARAEWRKALKLNVNHSEAMAKFTAYN
ncbi:MAG: tetratricopeptide repeat protein [Treponema sp.]|nr:tetratricopeptide repeat protein [Treponema sp.]